MSEQRSKWIPKHFANGATVSRGAWTGTDRNAMYTWRRRRAEALWKASQKPKPGTAIAADRAQKIAEQIIDHLRQFAPCELGGMVGNYWHSVIARRALWTDEAQQLATQVACLCRLSVPERRARHDKGKRGPGRAAPLEAYTPDPSAAPLMHDEELETAKRFADQHPNDPEIQAAYREYLSRKT